MRWPFRRSSAVDTRTEPTEESGPEQEPELTPDQAPAPEQDRSTAAWQDLPTMTPSLRAMPIVTDAGFSRSLPTRWNTPPALGALGHDVRTDMPGGLVSGVARTVDPRDTQPADLIWRMPDVSGIATPSTPAAPRLASTTLPTSTARPVQPGGTTQSVQPDGTAQSVQPDGTVQAVQPARTVQPAQPTDNSSASVSPSAGSSPIAASPDTNQTRQVLQNAAPAVEARDPRPVPADVTDGPAANAPAPGVTAEPGTETLNSPLSTPISDPGNLLTPREARPGPDPLGSAPAAVPPAAELAATQPVASAPIATAPLVSRTSLLRSLVQPTSRPQPTTQAATAASTGPASTSEPDAKSESGFTDTPPPPTMAPDFATSAPESGSDASESADGQPQNPQSRAIEPQFPLSPASPLSPTTTPSPASELLSAQSAQLPAAPTPTPSAMSAMPPVASDRPTAPAPAAAAATSRVAPLVSATRFIPTSAPINVLQAPTAPVDQPIRAAESILSTGSFASTFASPPASAGPAPAPGVGAGSSVLRTRRPAVQRAPTQSLLNHAIADLNTVASGVTHQAHQAQSVMRQPESTASQVASSADVPQGWTPVHAPAAHDPAALDSLARQLYGRFSRHLAGELLIDRERSQFLTDLT